MMESFIYFLPLEIGKNWVSWAGIEVVICGRVDIFDWLVRFSLAFLIG